MFHSVADKVSVLGSTRRTVRRIAWSEWKVYFPRSPQFSPEFFRPGGQWGKLQAFSASTISQISSFCGLVCGVDFGALVIIRWAFNAGAVCDEDSDYIFVEKHSKWLADYRPMFAFWVSPWILVRRWRWNRGGLAFSPQGDSGEFFLSKDFLDEYQSLWQTSRRRLHCSIARIKKHVKFSEEIKDYVDPQQEIAWNYRQFFEKLIFSSLTPMYTVLYTDF